MRIQLWTGLLVVVLAAHPVGRRRLEAMSTESSRTRAGSFPALS